MWEEQKEENEKRIVCYGVTESEKTGREETEKEATGKAMYRCAAGKKTSEEQQAAKSDRMTESLVIVQDQGRE